MPVNIAIDGPAGAGKSSVSKLVASKLGYVYVDTGALYRAVGLFMLRSGRNTKDAKAVADGLKDISSLEIKNCGGSQIVFLDKEDVSQQIRTPDASMAASDVSAVPAVREYLLSLQKDIAKENNCVMDGRDIGTVILPDAQVKIFLTASPQARAERRMLELRQKGIDEPEEKILEEINLRDYQDTHRKTAPLRRADDAVLIDTSSMNFEQSVDAVLSVIKEKTENLN